MTTLTYGGTLIETSCWCGIGVAIPQSLYNAAQRDHKKVIYCPLGHTFVYSGDTEAARLKRQLEYARDRAASETARADRAEASRRAWKGQATKARNRAAEGQCHFCGKFLVDLAVHVAKQHPDEHVRELTEQDASA